MDSFYQALLQEGTSSQKEDARNLKAREKGIADLLALILSHSQNSAVMTKLVEAVLNRGLLSGLSEEQLISFCRTTLDQPHVQRAKGLK